MPKAFIHGIEVHYQTKGSGPDVVMIHGLAANLSQWYVYYFPRLGEHYRVTAYDLRGHGLSGQTDSGYSSRSLAGDLLGLLDHLNIRRATLVAHSFGSSIALHAALLYPERVSGAVLLDPVVPCANRWYRLLRLWTGKDREPQLDATSGILKVASSLGGDGARSGQAMARTRTLLDRTLLGRESMQAQDLNRDALKKIHTPVLMLAGKRSPFRAESRYLRRFLPHCRTVEIADAGHFHAFEKPQATIERMRDFLDDCAETSAKELAPVSIRNARYDAVILTIGASLGEINPNLAIARSLARRGYRVLFAGNSNYESAVRDAGLDFEASMTRQEYEACAQRYRESPDDYRFLLDLMRRQMRADYRIVAGHCAPQGVVAAPISCLGARLAREKLGVSLVNLTLQPFGLRGYEVRADLPAYARPAARTMSLGFAALARNWALEPHLLPALNAFRVELGLPPLRHIYGGWIESPQCILGLFPEWFAMPGPGVLPQIRLTGFPLEEEPAFSRIPAHVAEFLESGPPPVLFFYSTSLRLSHLEAAKMFFHLAAQVCEICGCRALLLHGSRDAIPSGLPAGVRHEEYLPFGEVFPRASAVVHLGGIGTTAQALRAGVPQLILPRYFDQPDNADRVRSLGVGDWIPWRKATPQRVANALTAVLQSRRIASNCRTYAAAIASSDPIRETCDWIESLRFAERAEALQFPVETR